MSKPKNKKLIISEIAEVIPKSPWYQNVLILKAILFVFAFMFYFNSIPHGYALDDGLVLSENSFVKKGIDGIGNLFTHDSFYGTIGDEANLTGGRYRPLSLVLFAVEYEFVGNSPFFFHFMNVLLYGFTCVLLFNFFYRHIFKNQVFESFCAAFIFLIHPIHTEVVANIKSCDEILSLLFLILTLDFLLKYINNGKQLLHLITSLICFLFGLFSKENGLMFLGIVPMSIFFLSKENIKSSFLLTLPYLVIVILYIGMRVAFIGFNNSNVTELMDAPYLLASTSEKFGTIIFVLLKYIGLLFWPNPLTYDYSYNQIPYRSFSDPVVWLSILVYSGLIALAVYSFMNKILQGWCIGFFLFSIFIVSNIVINIGAPMGERFLYQPSIVLGITLVLIFKFLFQKFQFNKQLQFNVTVALLILITIPSFSKTYNRNKDWENGVTLGVHDVLISNHSARALTFAGVNYIKLSDSTNVDLDKNKFLEKAVMYLNQSIQINPKFSSSYINLGVAYFHLNKMDSAEIAWQNLKTLNPNSGLANNYLSYIGNYYSNKAMELGNKKEIDSSIYYYKSALKYQPSNAAIYHNIGSAFAMKLSADSCILYYTKATELDSTQALYFYDLGGIAFNKHQYSLAKKSWNKCAAMQPNYPGLADGLNALNQMNLK